MSTYTTLTRKNQITLPIKMVRHLGLHPADKVLIELEEGWMRATRAERKSFLDLRGIVKIGKKADLKKLRKQFERAVAKKVLKS